MGQMEMSQLQTNDLVLAMNSHTGQFQFSPVLMWLDRDVSSSEVYVNLTTKSGKHIQLTSSHLIYLADDEPMPDSANGDLNNKDKRGGSAPEQTNESPSDSGNDYYYDFVGVVLKKSKRRVTTIRRKRSPGAEITVVERPARAPAKNNSFKEKM